METVDNNGVYSTPKPINNKTLKSETLKGILFSDLEKKILFAYQDFVKKRTDLPAKVNERDRQSLENITGYFLEAGAGEPESIWKKMQANWEKLGSFYQAKISLEQIDKNFMSILDQIENYENDSRNHSFAGKACTATAKGERSHAERKNFRF